MPRRKHDETASVTAETGIHPDSRTILFFGTVCDETVARAVAALHAFDQDDGPIRIVLSSGGGDVDAGMTFYDAIRLNHNPVVIDVVGQAQSMAVVVLQAASLRRASPESRLMVHQGSVGVEGVPTHALGDISREIAFMHRRYCEILATRSGQSVSRIELLCKRESYMSVTEAKDLGLIDEVMATSNPMPVRVRRVRRKR